jgi:hypothetical protein
VAHAWSVRTYRESHRLSRVKQKSMSRQTQRYDTLCSSGIVCTAGKITSGIVAPAGDCHEEDRKQIKEILAWYLRNGWVECVR